MEGFDVGDEVARGILAQLGRRQGFPCSTLVEEKHAVDFWVEEGGVCGPGSASGNPVEEDCGYACGMAVLFVVDAVDAVERVDL